MTSKKNMEGKVVSSLAAQLGIKSDKIIRKGKELLSLADVRSGCSSLGALSLSGSCRAVLCLELAASAEGEPVDKAQCLRVSGMKSNKKVYNGALKALQCLLDLQPKTTIPELAVLFSCGTARQLALQILKMYEEKQIDGDACDYSRALFNTAALYTAARRQKLKVDKTKMIDVAGVKRATFDRLVADMDKEATALLQSKESTANKRKGKSFLDELEAMADNDVSPTKQSRKQENGQPPGAQEPYEQWKTRILTEAYKAMGQTYQS